MLGLEYGELVSFLYTDGDVATAFHRAHITLHHSLSNGGLSKPLGK